MDRIDQLIAKSRMGDLTDDESEELRQALLGTAPASPRFKAIASALNARNPSGFVEPTPETTGGLDPFSRLGVAFPEFEEGGAFAGGIDPRGTPTLDFFSELGANDSQRNPLDWLSDRLPGGGERPTPAAASDTQGELPIGSGTQIPETAMGQSKFDPIGRNADPEMGGMFGLASGGSSPSAGSSYLGGNPEDIYSDLGPPQGYTFSDLNAMGMERQSRDPKAYARAFAREAGGGDAYAALYEDPVKAAMAMAAVGMIGPGGMASGTNLQGGIGQSDSARLQAVEEFMRGYAGRETEVDPTKVYNQMFERALNTDMSMIESPQTEMPMTHEEIIDYTNASLMAAAPFMTEEGVAWMSSILTNMGNMYLDEVGSAKPGTEPMSYPQFLAAHDIDTLLGQ
jgi:hypothetical protein